METPVAVNHCGGSTFAAGRGTSQTFVNIGFKTLGTNFEQKKIIRLIGVTFLQMCQI
jgi:hypothetical protein